MASRFHPPARPSRAFEPRHHHLPPGTGTFGMTLFLISLGVLFVASILAYLLSRHRPDQPAPPDGLELPTILWASTVAIVASSYTIHTALQGVRHERQLRFRRHMMLTLLLGVAFLMLQAPGLSQLLVAHWQHEPIQLYGWVFFLILLHAAHLLGGLGPLAVVTYQAHCHRYDHEHHGPIKYLAMYWHFLDAVWIALFAVLLLG